MRWESKALIMANQEIQTRTSLVRVEPAGIVRVTMLPGVEETQADAQATMHAASTLLAGRRLPILVDMRNMKAQERQARQQYASPEAVEITQAVGLLVGSRVSQLIANFFITLTKVVVPTKLFTDEAEAITWLKGFLP